MTATLSRDEIVRALSDLPGWTLCDGAVHTQVTAPDFPSAVRLIDLIATDAEAADHHPDVDLRWRTVRITLSTHSAGGVTGKDLDLAARITGRAGEVGAELSAVAPASVLVAIDCVDAEALIPFWQAVLGYRAQADPAGDVELADPAGRGPRVWFQRMDPPRRERSRIHLDVLVPEELMVPRRDAAIAAGGRLLDNSHDPQFWVLADPEGNEVCLCRE